MLLTLPPATDRWAQPSKPRLGEQWIAMLPTLLRAWLGVGGKPKPGPMPKSDPRAALERRLRRAEAQAEELRRQIASLPAQRTATRRRRLTEL